ncbi:hypothetical protein P691DRAFT_783489 [Macrolepiota fuliginosa MF-IS2]|uniref:Uncharacterized protein n=1 Tax=Macrolepiota fuliginosa MF-IS2 TaxID=1400762 RepID=A0A9P5X849_9AGAR|nr:hypothetical protein P691DRAFT_783489 [Macrolepiota fuliginosa MF-IS2]
MFHPDFEEASKEIEDNQGKGEWPRKRDGKVNLIIHTLVQANRSMLMCRKDEVTLMTNEKEKNPRRLCSAGKGGPKRKQMNEEVWHIEDSQGTMQFVTAPIWKQLEDCLGLTYYEGNCGKNERGGGGRWCFISVGPTAVKLPGGWIGGDE